VRRSFPTLAPVHRRARRLTTGISPTIWRHAQPVAAEPARRSPTAGSRSPSHCPSSTTHRPSILPSSPASSGYANAASPSATAATCRRTPTGRRTGPGGVVPAGHGARSGQRRVQPAVRRSSTSASGGILGVLRPSSRRRVGNHWLTERQPPWSPFARTPRDPRAGLRSSGAVRLSPDRAVVRGAQRRDRRSHAVRRGSRRLGPLEAHRPE
jgi:hypothetical protein